MSINNVLSLIDLAGTEKRYNDYKNTISSILPKHIDKNRYMSIYLEIAKKMLVNDSVTNKKSILSCLFNAPKFGLNPDPIMGQIYFIPYKGKLTYQVGYKGMITLAGNAGIRVRSNLVYEKDEFDYFEKEDGQHFHHRPLLQENNRGKEICAYSVFTDTNTNYHQIHVMESKHIDDIKKIVLARMGKSKTPWLDKLFEPEMRKKTCVRRHSKTEPFSEQITQIIHHEEENEMGISNVQKHVELDNILENEIFPDVETENSKLLNS